MAALTSSLPIVAPLPTAPPPPPAFTRGDGRSPSQLRPLSFELSLLHRADGSVRYTQGHTTLLVAVYGPTLASSREERSDSAVLSFTFSSLSSSHSLTTLHASAAYHLREAFEPIVLTSLHPRQRISVHVQVVNDDGGLLACAVNACQLALMDAGVQCREMLAAVEIRLRKEDTQGGKEVLLLDPTLEETRTYPNAVTLAFPHLSQGVVLSTCEGDVEEAAYLTAFDTAKRAAGHLTHFMRQSLTKQFSVTT